MPDSYMADVSEWQSDIDADAYQRGGYDVLICRTYSGHDPDAKMPGRRDYLRGSGLAGIGWYCYLESGYDPADQARASSPRSASSKRTSGRSSTTRRAPATRPAAPRSFSTSSTRGRVSRR